MKGISGVEGKKQYLVIHYIFLLIALQLFQAEFYLLL